MHKLIATIIMAISMNAFGQSSILAVYEETANGLVRVDETGAHIDAAPVIDRYKIPGVVPYYPGTASRDYIQRPAPAPVYRTMDAYMLDCKCTRRIKVRVS